MRRLSWRTRVALSHDDYTVGWICALPLEMAAAQAALDEVHQDLNIQQSDHNTYTLGKIGDHNIVIACLPSGVYGTSSATAVATQLLSSFGSIRMGLMVGIGGGIPNKHADIRLGDVVVSKPTDKHSGVVQYDYGKALTESAANHLTQRGRFLDFLANIEHNPLPGQESAFTRPSQEDCLYQADYDHVDSNSKTCISCDPTQIVPRPPRNCRDVPAVHYGLIASANQVVKDTRLRDRLNKELGAYCVEMEAAGLMNDYPCLVVRGICDYADSHKNKGWQGYAAAAAAAFAKELLLIASGFRVPLNLTNVPAIDEFIGRQNELKHLWDELQPRCSPMRKVAILHGLGGIGKTQLAIHFSRIHKDDFSAIFWINGKDRGALTHSLASAFLNIPEGNRTYGIANEEDVERGAKSMLKWLGTDGNSRWLLIFDNVDQYSPPGDVDSAGERFDIYDFFPAADHGSIIITSRLMQLVELGKSHPVERLNSRDSIQLLTHMNELASKLDGLPLAITIAASYIRQGGMSVSQYLRHYEASWRDLMSNATPPRHYSQGNILNTWLVSYQEIHNTHPAAAALLFLLACFDNRDIWFELVQGCGKSSHPPAWLLRVVSNELEFVATLKPLITYSLIETKQEGGSYSMHPVVQEWCLHSFNDNARVKELDEFKGLALAAIGNMPPTTNEMQTSYMHRRLIPHADQMLRLLRVWEMPEEPEICMAIHDLGCVYLSQGMLKEAEESYKRALAGKKKLLGADHTSTLETMNNLGLVYTNRRKMQDAEQMLLGPKHSSTLHSVNNLGFLYTRKGNLEKAEKMYKRALSGFQKALGQDHTSTLDTINNLGLLYTKQNKLKQAGMMYQRAMAGFEKALGPDHTSTLILANNLGSLHQTQGKLLEAQSMYERARAGYKKILGPDHPSTIMIEHNLENLTQARGKSAATGDSNQGTPAGVKKRKKRKKKKKRSVAQQSSSAEPHLYALGKVSYGRRGRAVPSMVGWWQCCGCCNMNNPGLTNGYCSVCSHDKCLACTPCL
ncbi:hypothetical protein BDW59DRAFT_181989 [Aspergillus cavernicola]|uniref:Nucleoside phosphorylase domain-containing protein n=1 Tax=Aspergillus cavernicola TaxID=176166 RepID=A0ABR4HQY3_9EURO